MSPALYFDYFVAPSLSELKQRRSAERGLDDGVAGRAPAMHSPEYQGAYARGRLFRAANEREVALTFGNAWRCLGCRSVYEGPWPALCGCTPMGTPVEAGAIALYGPGEPDDDGDFYSTDELRQLCREGVAVLTLSGDRLNEQILLQ